MVSPSPLDHTAFPHILDRILALSSWSTKLYLRRVSRALRDRIDADLFHHLVLFSDPPPAHDTNASPKGIASVELFAPGARPLPPVRWEPHNTIAERMDAMRKLSYVRVLDWGAHMDHPTLWGFPADKQRSALELAAQTQSLVPLLGLLTNVEVVRYDDGQLAPLGAKTHIAFDNFVSLGPRAERSVAGPWLHWGDGILLLPAGVEKLILHIRYDPRHPNLDRSYWDLENVFNYPLHELVVLARPTQDIPRDIPEADGLREDPVLGFLDDLFKWAMVLCARGAKVTFVGLDTMPASNLRMPEDEADPAAGAETETRPSAPGESTLEAKLAKLRTAARKRVKHIAAGIAKLAVQGIQQWQELYDADFPYGHDEEYDAVLARLQLSTWSQYAAETTREEYALAMVRPGFRSLPQRDFLGFPWRDDELHIYPRRGGASHLDWLEGAMESLEPPPLSPRPRPLDGDRAVRESKFRAGGECGRPGRNGHHVGAGDESMDEVDDDDGDDEGVDAFFESMSEDEDEMDGMAHDASDIEL